jgi:hypothetical protein
VLQVPNKSIATRLVWAQGSHSPDFSECLLSRVEQSFTTENSKFWFYADTKSDGGKDG